MNSKHILVTGASGLLGSRLTEMLLAHGYRVSHLGRTKKDDAANSFLWDVENQFIEPGALDGVDAVVNLAGASVADTRWTKGGKKLILESRTKSTALLFNELQKKKNNITTFVSASAMGYYGLTEEDHSFVETDLPGNNFLADVTKQWEEQMDKIQSLSIRVVKFRISVVLAASGGALDTMAKPIKWLVGAPLGSGKQFVSWIHIEDMCRLFILAIENDKMKGPYNAATSTPVTNKELTKAIAKVLHKPLLLPPVPAFVLRAILGQMAEMVVKGSKLSVKKIQDTGFVFRFTDLDDALNDLLVKKK